MIFVVLDTINSMMMMMTVAFALQALQPCDNLALMQSAMQSSMWPGTGANFIVDGNTNSAWSFSSCSQTNTGDSQPWMAVDLGSLYNVASIVFTSRSDCCREYFSNSLFLADLLERSSTELLINVEHLLSKVITC